jgi:hypothetical protein
MKEFKPVRKALKQAWGVAAETCQAEGIAPEALPHVLFDELQTVAFRKGFPTEVVRLALLRSLVHFHGIDEILVDLAKAHSEDDEIEQQAAVADSDD